MKKLPLEMNLEQLTKQSGVPARTIRLYISMGLVPGPLRAGRNAAYGAEHLERIARIRELQREGMTLSQVKRKLLSDDFSPQQVVVSSWRQYVLTDDVMVSIKEGVSPWRAHVLQNALEQFNRLIQQAETEKEQAYE